MTSDTNDPQVEANKATVRHILECLSAGDVSGFTDHLSPNYVRHCQAIPGQGHTKEALWTIPPSGKTMDLVIMGMHRFDGGVIAETWTSWDNLAALMQLGHFPPAAS